RQQARDEVPETQADFPQGPQDGGEEGDAEQDRARRAARDDQAAGNGKVNACEKKIPATAERHEPDATDCEDQTGQCMIRPSRISHPLANMPVSLGVLVTVLVLSSRSTRCFPRSSIGGRSIRQCCW